jgi:hypothetical protein
MTMIEYLDWPPVGWFVLDVMRQKSRGWGWVALVIDVDPDDLKKQRLRFSSTVLRSSQAVPAR